MPDDVSVTGFDDLPMAAFTIPPLTTVRMPISEMVAAAVQMVVAELGGEPLDPGATILLRPTLKVRESTSQAPEWSPVPVA